ncbi:MAG: endonuclease [bacterium]
MQIFFLSQILFLLLFVTTFAQIPPGYYDAAGGLSGTALQSALHNTIKNHTVVDYGSLYTWFQTTDMESGNVVRDMYSDVPGGTPPYVYHYNSGDECGNYGGEGACYNREHSWPKSWFGGEVSPMYTDLFHLYPTDGYVNNQRNNYPYGDVGSVTWTSLNGSRLGSCSDAGYTGTVFEPIDDYKGDFARTYFYMSTRYYTEDNNWPGSPMTDGSQLKPWALQVMLDWSAQDPVSEKETSRNNAVYQVQHNRNPFIDHPEFVNEIWGFPVGARQNHGALSLKIFPNPCSEFCTVGMPSPVEDQVPTIMIISMNGTIWYPEFRSAGPELTINMHSLPAGIYCLMLKSDQRIWYSRLVKE